MTYNPSATSGVLTSLASALHGELKPLAVEVNELLAGRTKSVMPAALTKLQSVCLFAGLWGVGIYLGALRDLSEQVLELNGRDANKADLAERHRVLSFGLNTLSGYLKDLTAGTTVSYLHLNQAFGKLVRRARPELLEMDAKLVDQLLFMAAPPTLEIVGSFEVAKDASRQKLLATIATASLTRESEDLQALVPANPYLSLCGYTEAIAALVDEQRAFEGPVYRELIDRLVTDLARLQEELAAGEPLTPPVCDPYLFSSILAAIAALKEPGERASAIRAKYGLIDAAQAGAMNDRARTFVEALDKAVDGLAVAAKRNVLRGPQNDAQELARHADQLPSAAFKAFALQLRDITAGWKTVPPVEADWVQAMGLLMLMRACAQTWGNEAAQAYLAEYAATMDIAPGARLVQCLTLQEGSSNAALVKMFKLMSQEADHLSVEMDLSLKLMAASTAPVADAASVVANAGAGLARRAGKLHGLFTWVGLPVAAATALHLAEDLRRQEAWASGEHRDRMVVALSELRVLLTRLRPTSMLDLELLEEANPAMASDVVATSAADEGRETLPGLDRGGAEENGWLFELAGQVPGGAPADTAGASSSGVSHEPASVFGSEWAHIEPQWPDDPMHVPYAEPVDLAEPGDPRAEVPMASSPAVDAPAPVVSTVEAGSGEGADLLPPEVVDAFRAAADAEGRGPELENELLLAMEGDEGPGEPAAAVDPDPEDDLTFDPLEELRKNLAVADAEHVDKLQGSNSLLTVLFEEVETCVTAIRQCIGEIRSGETEERVSEIRRRIHTLKGAARTCKLDASGFILHELETFLDLVPDDNQALVPTLDVVQEVFEDACRRLDVAKSEFMGLGEVPASPAASEPRTPAPEAVAPDVSPARKPPTAAAETQPPAAPIRATATVDANNTVRIPVSLATTVGQTSGSLLAASQDSITRMENLQRLMQSVSQMVVRIGPISRELQMLARSAGLGTNLHGAGFDALELERSTALQDMAQQLAEAAEDMSSHADSLTEALRSATAGQRNLAGIAVDLQRQSSELLLVPVESQRSLLLSTVERACLDTGKKVDLVIDRAARMPAGVVDRLSNVIGHILRNAVAHGIEEPAARVAAGKAETGTITLGAPRSGAIKGGFVQLAIRDDGAGIDLGRVLSKAIQRGLVRDDMRPGDMSPEQVRDLVFAKGFSTAEHVTQLAGRGVGLDVVRSYLKSIGGEVMAVQPPEGGTEFVLTLPVDAASMAVIPVVAGGYRCLVPSSLVARIVPASSAGVTIDWEQGRVAAAGHTFPLRDLRRHVPAVEANVRTRGGYLLFMRDGTSLQAVFVDAVERQQRVITKSLGPVIRDIPGFVAAAHADTSGLTLVLNPVDLPAARAQRGLTSDASSDGEEQRTIMVVDDSTTVQKASRLFLEGLGYNVLSAGNGKQALDMLAASESLPHLILSDIEMPVMNGFDLLGALKRNERTRQVPVVIISSRTSERHQAQAMDLGAARYMMKPFDEFEVRRYLDALFASPEASMASESA